MRGRDVVTDGASPERLERITPLAQLGPVAVGGIEVVADDLLELGEALAGRPLKPVGEALVELGPLGLRQGGVGGVADEDVAEAEGIARAQLGPVGPDELLPDEGEEGPPDGRPEDVVGGWLFGWLVLRTLTRVDEIVSART